jgi:outer membrane protein TolC
MIPQCVSMPNRSVSGALLLGLLALSACTTLPPRPAIDRAEALTEALPQSAPAELEAFGSAPATAASAGELDTATITRRVLLRHPALAAARARLDGAELEAWLISRPAQPMLRLMPMLSEGRFRLEALLMQPLAEWLSRDLRSRLSEVEAERASAELVATVLDQVIEAQRAFHTAILAEHHAALAAEALDIAEQRLQLVGQRLRRGEASAENLIAARAEAARAQARLARDRRLRVDARSGLAAALGEPSAAELRLPMQLPALLALRSQAQSLGSDPARAEAVHPSLRVARLAVESATLQRLLLEHWSSRWMPALGAGGGLGGMREQRLELELALPLWGRPGLEIERGRASEALANAEREALEREQLREVERALAALEQAEREAEASRQAQAEARALQELGAALLERGEVGIEALWLARERRIESERERMEAEAEALAEALALQRWLGRFEAPD